MTNLDRKRTNHSSKIIHNMSSSSSSDNDSSTSSEDGESDSKTAVKKQEDSKVKDKKGGAGTPTNARGDSFDSEDSDQSSDSDSDSSSSSSNESNSNKESKNKSTKKSKDAPASTVKIEPRSPKSTVSGNKLKSPSKSQKTKKSVNDDDESIKEILKDAIKNPEDFSLVRDPGPLTVDDINSDNEYFIFRFPVGMLNPLHLADTKISINTKRKKAVTINNKPYEIMSYACDPNIEAPSLFLPDQGGQLKQADLEISGQVVIQQIPPELKPNNVVQYNIDELKRTIHQPPEIKERSFFERYDNYKYSVKKEKSTSKVKKKKKKDFREEFNEQARTEVEENMKLKEEKKKLKKEKKLAKYKEDVTLEANTLSKKSKKHKKEDKKRKYEEETESVKSSPKKKKIKQEL